MNRITYLFPERPIRTALGASVRRKGFIMGLQDHGVQVTEYPLQHRKGRLPEILSMIILRRRERKGLSELKFDPDKTILIEGIPTALALILVNPFRSIKCRVFLDICDSWYLLSAVGSHSSNKILNNLRTYIKRLLAQAILKMVTSKIKNVSYISGNNANADRIWLNKYSQIYIIGNSAALGRAKHSPKGNIVCVGDWSYLANISMLKNNIDWIQRMNQLDLNLSLDIVGPNLDTSIVTDSNIRYVGWVEDILEAYQGKSCSIALISEGAGVKNKVLESLSLGIPVIGTYEAFESIPAPNKMALVTSEFGPSPQEYYEWMSTLIELDACSVSVQSWKSNVDSLVNWIRDEK